MGSREGAAVGEPGARRRVVGAPDLTPAARRGIFGWDTTLPEVPLVLVLALVACLLRAASAVMGLVRRVRSEAGSRVVDVAVRGLLRTGGTAPSTPNASNSSSSFSSPGSTTRYRFPAGVFRG